MDLNFRLPIFFSYIFILSSIISSCKVSYSEKECLQNGVNFILENEAKWSLGDLLMIELINQNHNLSIGKNNLNRLIDSKYPLLRLLDSKYTIDEETFVKAYKLKNNDPIDDYYKMYHLMIMASQADVYDLSKYTWKNSILDLINRKDYYLTHAAFICWILKENNNDAILKKVDLTVIENNLNEIIINETDNIDLWAEALLMKQLLTKEKLKNEVDKICPIQLQQGGWPYLKKDIVPNTHTSYLLLFSLLNSKSKSRINY